MAKNVTKYVPLGVVQEFKEFLKEYKIFALAIAFIMGVAATALIKSLVDNIIMPIIGLAMPGVNWQDLLVQIGAQQIKYGLFIGELINFVIIAFVVFLMAKFIMKEDKVTKK